MNNPINRINKALKTKEDMQSFVLVAAVLFILFVKGYMLLNSLDANEAGNPRNADIIKTEAKTRI